MSHSLLDIGKPGMSPGELNKKAPRAPAGRSFAPGDEHIYLAEVLTIEYLHCRCGATTVASQQILIRTKKRAGGHTWLQADRQKIRETHPDLPREIVRLDRQGTDCIECFPLTRHDAECPARRGQECHCGAPIVKEVGDSWVTARMP